MSKESQATPPPTDFIFANLLAESAWGKSYDFSKFYTWTMQQANDATTRGRGHDSECHKTATELEILAKSMREHCASTKLAYAKIEGYEILLANIALELRKREGQWGEREKGYKITITEYERKVTTLESRITELESTIAKYESTIQQVTETKEDWYRKLRAAVALLLNTYPEDVAVTTATSTVTSVSGTASTTRARTTRVSAASSSTTSTGTTATIAGP